jgi:hypothetical protein
MRERRWSRQLLVAALLTVACPIAARAASVGLHRFAAQVADAQI